MITTQKNHNSDVLDAMDVGALESLVVNARAELNRRKQHTRQSLHSDMSRLARAAGLSAEEWKMLAGD